MKGIIAASMLVLSIGVHAGQEEIDLVEDAYMVRNSEALVQLSDITQGYDQALARYRLAGMHMSAGKAPDAVLELKLAAALLEKLVKKTPENVESWALLSSVYGMIASLQTQSFGEFGPKAGIALAKAMALDEKNPRVQLIQGLTKFHAPEQYGGSKSEALKAFTKATQGFNNNHDLMWGQAEAYIWLGLTQQALGNKTEAEQSWKKALDIAPRFQWAQMLLTQ